MTNEESLITKACRLIETSEEMPRLDELAMAIGLSPSHFHRLFKSATGVTPKKYGETYRYNRLQNQLGKAATITEAIYDAGFNASTTFYDASKRLGMTPKIYRAGGKTMKIHFAIGKSSLGSVLVASTEQGICAILINNDPDFLLRDLQDRFPNADLIGGDKTYEKTIARVIALIEAPHTTFDLPLDIRGTVFQQKVWQALRAIPVGKTASYTEIANGLGMPKAVRAVAQACAANKIAVAIPCHRVVRNDGNLSGYRWGIENKKTLLEREKN